MCINIWLRIQELHLLQESCHSGITITCLLHSCRQSGEWRQILNSQSSLCPCRDLLSRTGQHGFAGVYGRTVSESPLRAKSFLPTNQPDPLMQLPEFVEVISNRWTYHGPASQMTGSGKVSMSVLSDGMRYIRATHTNRPQLSALHLLCLSYIFNSTQTLPIVSQALQISVPCVTLSNE